MSFKKVILFVGSFLCAAYATMSFSAVYPDVNFNINPNPASIYGNNMGNLYSQPMMSAPASTNNMYGPSSTTTATNTSNTYGLSAAPTANVSMNPDTPLLTQAPANFPPPTSITSDSALSLSSPEKKPEVKPCDCYDAQDPNNAFASNFLYDARSQQRISRINPACPCEPHAAALPPPEPIVINSSEGTDVNKKDKSATSQDKTPTALQINY